MSAPQAEEPKYPSVTVQLTGEDGNAFAIMGRVSDAIRREVDAGAAIAYVEAAMSTGSYEEFLRFTTQTVHVR